MPNIGPYIYDVSISGFTRTSICIYDISSLRVKIYISVFGVKNTSILRHTAITLSNVVMSLPCFRNKFRLRVCVYLISYIHRFDSPKDVMHTELFSFSLCNLLQSFVTSVLPCLYTFLARCSFYCFALSEVHLLRPGTL